MTKEEWVRIFEVLDKAGAEPMLCDTPVECFENEVPCGPFRAMGDPVSHVEMLPAEVLRGIDSCMVTVTGDSMKDADILPGDKVRLEADTRFEDGDIVVIMCDGEMTLKAFCTDEDGKPWLVPQNDAYDAISLSEAEGIWPVGKVTEIVRKAPRVSFRSCLKRIREAREKAEEPRLTLEEAMAGAVERSVERGLWSTNTCWSVVYAVCQLKGYGGGYSDFVRDVASWPFSREIRWKCTLDSVSRPLRNAKMLNPISQWEASGVKASFCLLANCLLEELRGARLKSIQTGR